MRTLHIIDGIVVGSLFRMSANGKHGLTLSLSYTTVHSLHIHVCTLVWFADSAQFM